MGRRKGGAKKAVKKKRPTVAKVFKCIMCNHEKSVTCRLNQDTRTGELNCNICNASYKTHLTDLTEAIDVFTDWLDATHDEQIKAMSKYALRPAAQERVDRLLSEDREAHEEDDLDTGLPNESDEED